MISPPCPEDSELRAFLQGTSATDGIATHINACLLCQSRLDGLSAGSVFEEEAAANLREVAVDDATRIAQALDEIKASGEQASSDEVAFPPGFLGPSDYPGAIGRLGQYEMLQLLGRGGMGAVFKAYDPSLHRIVAIKLLAPHLAHNPQARKRFIREAQAAAAVSHDHVVTTHAIDESAEQPAIVMQYVSGRSLQQKLDADGALELKEILRIGLQTAAGLAAAHAQGLVHRDVKPANILLENGVQRVKLTDFGLARTVDDYGLTASGVIAGTPQYMAPEQAQGETITARADLFSLGSVMYAMCTGHSPFRASTTMGVLKNVCDATPRPIRDLNPDVPDWLCAIIDRLLAKDPARRFATAKEVAELLEQWLAHVQRPLSVPSPAPVCAPPAQIESIAAAAAEPATAVVDDDDESPVQLGRTPDERQLLQRAFGYVELPGHTLMGVGGFSLIALWLTQDWQNLQLWGSGWPTGGRGWLTGTRELFQAGGPLLQSAAFVVMVIAGNSLPRLQSRTLGVVGAVLSNMTATLPVPGVLGVAVGIWVLMTLLRSDVIEAFHLAAELRRRKREEEEAARPASPVEPSTATEPTVFTSATGAVPAEGVDAAREALRGPANGLMFLGGLGLLLTLAVYVALIHSIGLEVIARRPQSWNMRLIFVMSLLAIFGAGFSLMLVAGRRMAALQSFWTSAAGCVSAMLVTPSNIVGLPLGVWGLVVLRRPEVRRAFAAQRAVERTDPAGSAGLALLSERLRDPAAALFLVGLLNWLLLVVLALIALQAGLQQEYAFRQLTVPQLPWLAVVGVLFAVTASITMAAGLQMLRVRSYPLALAGAGCAAVTVPGLLVGLPVAAWVLLSLIPPEVRAAFSVAGSVPRMRSERRVWHVWRRQQFWIVLACVAAGLWLVQQGGLNFSSLRSSGSSSNRSAPSDSEARQAPPSFTLTRPDQTLPIGRTDARRMAVSPGGALVAVAGGSDNAGFVKIWNAQTLQELALMTSPQAIHCLAFGDHGKVLATGEADGKVRVRDGRTGVVQWEIDAHAGPVSALAFSPAYYSLVSGGEDGAIRLWTDRKARQIELSGHSAAVTDVTITNDGTRIAAACRNSAIRFWDATGNPVEQLSYPVVPLRISLDEPNGPLGVAFEDGSVQVLSLRDRTQRSTWSLPSSRPTSLRTGFWNRPRAGVFITGARDGSVRLHDFIDFRQCVLLRSASPVVGADLIGPQDRIVSAHSDGQLRIWNLNRQ